MAARCPHCQAQLSEAATFCAACGRRIEGWTQPPSPSAHGEPAAPLPGGEEPTRQMEPTPSLLRAAAVSKAPHGHGQGQDKKAPSAAGPVETDSAMMRAYKRNPIPLVIALVLLALSAGAGAFFVLRRQAAPVEPGPPLVVAPAPEHDPNPPAPSPVVAPAKTKGAKKKRALRINTEKVAVTPNPNKPAPKPQKPDKPDKTGLPHKVVETDSKSTAPPPENLPTEATPMTEEEMKAQGEASINADHIRFVVRSHMAQVRACYDRANKDFGLSGTVEVAFAISTEGRPVKLRTEANTTGSDLLAKCLETRIKEWQFPRPVGGEYELIYPFQFGQGS